MLFFVGAVVDCTDLIWQFIGNHSDEFFLISVPDRLFVVPAFEFQHIQSTVHPCDLLLHMCLLRFKQCLALRVGGRPFYTPIHELPDVLDLHAGLFQTLDDPECFDFRLTKLADAGYPLHVRKQPLFIINGSYALAGGVVDPLSEDAPQFVKDYYAYYKTPRGYHPRSLNSNNGWNVTSSLSFLNMPILQYSSEIRSAVLLVHGEKAHSRYFSETAYSKLTGDNKELLIIPGANHTDLSDQMDVIPFEKLKAFFEEYLK